MNSTPASLLERLRQPAAEQAWHRFVNLLTPLCYSWASRLGFQGDAAAKLVQDALSRLYRTLLEAREDQRSDFGRRLQDAFLAEAQRYGLTSPDAAGAGAEGELLIGSEELRQYLLARAVELLETEFPPDIWNAFKVYRTGSTEAAAAPAGISAEALQAAKFYVWCRLRQELAGMLD